MKWIIFAVILSFFLCAQIAYCEDLKVLEITGEGQVLIRDGETGEEWLALEGDEIRGWIITSVEGNSVVMRKEPEGDMPQAVVRTLTMPNKLSIKPVGR